jgi:hypothetical protein
MTKIFAAMGLFFTRAKGSNEKRDDDDSKNTSLVFYNFLKPYSNLCKHFQAN